MSVTARQMSYEQFCEIIDILSPCMDDFLYVYELETDRYKISTGAVKRFNLPAAEYTDVIENHKKFTYPDDVEMLVEDLNQLVSGKKKFHNLQYRWLNREEEPIWINCRGCVVDSEDGQPGLMVGCINEIGKKQKADNVSGLLGESSMKQYINGVHEVKINGYVLRVGIDGFRGINEKKGIEYGEWVLRRTAECISSVIKPGQQLFRLAADEFAVVDFLGGTVEEAEELYRDIRRAINRFIKENQYEVFYTISGGIRVIGAEEDDSYAEIMKHSEFALDQAKKAGKNRCHLYRASEYESFLRKKKLIGTMRYSVNNDFEGFETYFQPIVSAKERRLSSAETLLRFHSEKTGMISPVEFIPLLESSGLIIPVGRWVLKQAVSMCKRMQQFVPDFQVSVNLSYVQVLKSDVLKDILDILEEYELTPSSLIVELTESGFIESSAHFDRFCKGLKEHGILLYLDDFGTGYSNFHYLSEISPNTIKIDRTFTTKALNNVYEHSLLKHIIDMVHSIQLKMCVEGIETEEELQAISQMGPDFIQGYYFGRPCPESEFFEKYAK